MTAPVRLTDSELRLAEQYACVLDFASRCAQAVDGGNVHYLREKAGQLERAAATLAHIADDLYKQAAAGGPLPRSEALAAAVAHFGRHYRAGRLLHPLGPEVPEVGW